DEYRKYYLYNKALETDKTEKLFSALGLIYAKSLKVKYPPIFSLTKFLRKWGDRFEELQKLSAKFGDFRHVDKLNDLEGIYQVLCTAIFNYRGKITKDFIYMLVISQNSTRAKDEHPNIKDISDYMISK